MILLPKILPVKENEYIEMNINDQFFLKNPNYFQNAYRHFCSGNMLYWNNIASIVTLLGFAPLWFMAKRLYLFGIIHICLGKVLLNSFILLNIIHTFEGALLLNFIFNVCVSLLLGMYGNFVHFLWVQKWKQRYINFSFKKGLDFKRIIEFFVLCAIQIFIFGLANFSLGLAMIFYLIMIFYLDFERPVKRTVF